MRDTVIKRLKSECAANGYICDVTHTLHRVSQRVSVSVGQLIERNGAHSSLLRCKTGSAWQIKLIPFIHQT